MKSKYPQIYQKAHPRVRELIDDKLTNRFSKYDYNLVLKKSDTNYWKEIKPRSWSDTFQESHPTFFQIIKYEGIERAELICHYVFADANVLGKDDRNLIISFLLSEDGFTSFTILDLKYCLLLGKLGKLKKQFGDLKVSDITGIDGWFESYFQERIKQNQIYKKLIYVNGVTKDPIPSNSVDISNNAIPPPKEYLEKRKELELKIHNNRIKERKDIPIQKYLTIESYVNDSEENKANAKKLEETWIKEYNSKQQGMKLKAFLGIKWTAFLFELRKGN